jgi:transcriptional regulator with XRE-family HTH domain
MARRDDGAVGSRFGGWLRRRREEIEMPLRTFAIRSGLDPGNLSKYERGILPAPQEPDTLERIARALGLKKDSVEEREFLDLASASAGRIPPDIANDPEVLARMPLLFRTARGKLTRDELIQLAERLKKI